MPNESASFQPSPYPIRPTEMIKVRDGITAAMQLFNKEKCNDYACHGCGSIQEGEPVRFYKSRDGNWVLESPRVDTTGWAHINVNTKTGPPRIERYCPQCVDKMDAAVKPQQEVKDA